MTVKVRVGLVGGGKIAEVAELPALAANPQVEIVGISTATAESAQRLVRRWPIECAYPDAPTMVDHARLDALFVLTPRMIHAQFVELGLTNGLDVFCEKPLAPTASEAHRLADLADEQHQLLMVGFNRRYAEVYAVGRAEFGEAGPDFCVAQKNRSGSEYRASFENAIHMVDLLRWYCLGEAEEVTAHALAADQYEEQGLAALIRFGGGAVATLMAARTAGAWDERLDAYGQMASVGIVAPDSVRIDRGGMGSMRDMRSKHFGWATATTTMGFKPAVDHFIECVRTRQEPLTNGREAALTQTLMDRILEAAQLPTQEAEGREWTSRATS